MNIGLLITWILANVAGCSVSFVLAQPAGFPIIWVALAAAPFQWLVLRRRVTRAGWWVLASFVGGVAFYALLWLLEGIRLSELWDTLDDVVGTWASGMAFVWTPSVTDLFPSGAVFGAVIGLAQCLALRRWARHAAWWVLASVIAWAVAWAVADGGHWWIPPRLATPAT